MADRLFTTVLAFNGGFATDLAPQVRQLDFLTKAENLVYEVSGAVRKVGGSTRINATAITGSPDVLGMTDFWLTGTTGNPVQKFVSVNANQTITKEDMDGVVDDITGAAVITANAYPVFATLTDLLTIWTSAANTPLKWNQTGNVASLGGTPPAARVAAQHLNRMWAAGTNANASRLFYSAFGNIEDWTGADTGSIDIDLNDGDRIIGLASNRGRLLVFKGPNRGSIHQISGTAPTGSDAWSRQVLVRGIPLQTHNSIVEVGDDLWFMSDRGIHSVAATEKFGNFEGVDLTRFLRGFLRSDVNRTRLANVWGVNWAEKQAVVWSMTRSGQAEEDMAFGLSYIRLKEEGILKPFTWSVRECLSVAIRDNPTNRRKELVFGSTDGFWLRQDTSDRNLEGMTAYTMRVMTPSVILAATDTAGKPRGDQPVQLYRMYMRTVPTGNYDISVRVTRDNATAETYTFNQQATGAVFDTAIFDTDVWGGGGMLLRTADMTGEARAIELDITQGGLNQDANIHEIGVEWKPVAGSGATSLA